MASGCTVILCTDGILLPFPARSSAIAGISIFFIYQHFSLDKQYLVLYSYAPTGPIASQGCRLTVENFNQEEKPLDGQRLRIGGIKMRKMQSLGLGLVFMALVVALLCTANPAWGQDVTASITGTVTDPSGAPIVGASVIAKET